MILSTLRPLFGYYDVTCAQLLHPHTDSCLQSNVELLWIVCKQSLKLYLVLYLVLRGIRGKLSPKAYIIDVLRSTLFLMINGPFLSVLNCVLDKILGVAYKFNVVFTTGIVSSALAYLVESRSRQRILTPYMICNCVDSIMKVFVLRNYLPYIPYLDVLLFMLVSGRTCGKLSTRVNTTGFNDSIFMLLTNPIEMLRRRSYSSHQMLSLWLHRLLPESDILKIPIVLTGGCVWGLLIGLSYSIVTLLVSRVSKLLSGSREDSTGTRRRRRLNLKIPFLLASYIGLFQLLKAILRNVTPLSDTISGFLAGSAISIYRFPSLSLYLFVRDLLTISKSLMYSGYLPRIPFFNHFLYVIFTGTLLHCCVHESKYVNPAYMHFMLKFSSFVVPNLQSYLKIP